MKRFSILCMALVSVILTTAAQEKAYKILHETDTTIKAKLGGVSLGSRAIRHFIYEYPSKDADGKTVTVSSVMMVPSDIVEGKTPCDGMVLFHHSTIGDPSEAPSQDGGEMLGVLLANPLKPNYIIVASDNIGYGSSADHNLAYLCGDVNARNALDGLLVAREILTERQISQGKYLFNLGYSQGGTDAMYAARLRDMEYKDDIVFTKTFAGGGVMDCEKAYTEFAKDGNWDSMKDIAIMLISLNENYHLGINYDELFKEPIASSVPEFLKTKKKSSLNLQNVDSLNQLLQPVYMDLRSEPSQKLLKMLSEVKIANGWEPDLTQNYFIEHSRHDNYVPVQSVRSLLKYMKENGFKNSIVPGKTNLQTNMLVFKLKHQPSAIVWAIQTLAAIQFWPVLYYEGEQNRYYHDVVKDLNLMKVIKYLESWGLDLRKIVSNAPSLESSLRASFADGSLRPDGSVSQLVNSRRANIFEILQQVESILNKVDLTTADALEMLDDSGITLLDIMEVVQYFQSSPAPTMQENVYSELNERVQAPLYLLRSYEQTLASWFMLAGYDVNYSSWGW